MGKRDFDNNLKHQGWEQMNTILDKEMPGKRGKKKLFFIILLIPFLIFLIISGTRVFGNKQQASNKFAVKTISHKEINNTNSIKSYNTDTKNNNQTIEEKSNTNISEKSSIKSNSNTKINKTRKNINTKHKQSRKVQITKNDFALSEFNSSNSNAVIKPVNTGLSNTSKNDYISNISKLNSLSIQNLSTKQNIVYLSKIKLKKHKNIDLFNLFAGTKMYIYSIKELQTKFGLEIGNRFSYSTRFFTDISLAYTQSQIIVSQIELKADTLIADYVKEEYFGKSNIVLDNRNSNLRFGIFQLSLDQGYRFSTKLSTSIGMSIGYTKLVNKYDFIDSNSLEGIDHIDIILDRFRYSSQINISYQIFKNLSFNIGYKHYFSTIYKAKSSKDVRYFTKIKPKDQTYSTNIGVRFWF